ncbi:hypothetical protein ACLVWU_01415 [Bdellovibrio sp. HCB290]|uniref:hypothetical protein n=1 Tax=Bdellovibrio sp. HCB290 TaxID=3394356 RepID=UPI0039B424B9
MSPIKAILHLSLFIVGLGLSLATHASEEIERGLYLSKSETLRELELKGFSLPALLMNSPSAGRLSNQDLAKVANYQTVVQSIKTEVADFQTKNADLGRFFDVRFLQSPNARFVLVGAINRADRGFHTGNKCGETRFVYRLTYQTTDNGKAVFSRLPMTINLVYRAGIQTDDSSCAELAASWLKMSDKSTSAQWTEEGPLQSKFFNPGNLDRLEINLQVVRAGAGAAGDFGGHAEYLLKVYKMANGAFLESTLENQIDRSLLSNNPALLAELKQWLLKPENIIAADQGTLLIPTKFLAKSAYSLAPGGIARSANRAFYGLVKQEDVQGVEYDKLNIVKSPAGFIRRLNDSTCTGCHQTRAIGGFHFTGKDPLNRYPGNSVFLPASPHFLSDLGRRRDLVNAIANKQEFSFARGFSARPYVREPKELENSGLYNGWGAHCATADASFSKWSCAKGLTCKQFIDISDKSGMGICINEVQQVGDPCEFGSVSNSGFRKDQYSRFPVKYTVNVPNAQCSPQSQLAGTKTGGFLFGSVRLKSCQNGPGEPGLPPEAECGPLPAVAPGFNACIGTKNFDECLREFSMGVGLRGCDAKNPCRDDYICAESFRPDRGVCVPPYFLFQFRVDGHPRGDQ